MSSLKILICISFVIFVSCNNDKQGTNDGGGGIVEGSTPAEIKDAVYYALGVVIDPRFQNDYRTDKLSLDQKNSLLSTLWCIFDNKGCPQDKDYIGNNKSRDTHLKKYILDINIYFRDTDSCKYANNQSSDASVTAFNRGATICFSTMALQKIPKISLKAHMVGLLMHELAHMSGQGEEVAKLVEAESIKAYNVYKYSMLSQPVVSQFYLDRIARLHTRVVESYKVSLDLRQNKLTTQKWEQDVLDFYKTLVVSKDLISMHIANTMDADNYHSPYFTKNPQSQEKIKKMKLKAETIEAELSEILTMLDGSNEAISLVKIQKILEHLAKEVISDFEKENYELYKELLLEHDSVESFETGAPTV